jgi:hypothetical protein
MKDITLFFVTSFNFHLMLTYSTRYWSVKVVRDISVVKGWTVRGSNPGGAEIFRTRPDRCWGPPSLLYNGYRVFPGGGVTLTTKPHLAPMLKKE